MKKQKENSHEGITWSEMGKQNEHAEKVYYELLSSVDCNVGSGKYGEELSNPSILSNCT